MTTRDLSFLQELCPDAHVRPKLAKPFRAVLDGESWALATDGQCLVAVRQENDFTPWPEKEFERVTGTFSDATRLTLEPQDLAAVRQWCRTRFRVACEDCHGTGIERCECPACGHTHDASCSACELVEGTKGPGHAGRFLGRRVNRGIVERALAWLPMDATISGGHSTPTPETPIVFKGEDWLVLVMPTRDVPSDMGGEIDFPALAAEQTRREGAR